ncbi:hypothetical protein ACFFMR_11715 [Micromonospora andamanensis]|uniref:Mutator family transposase n=1 Tax=Micromonospora andamanensis TaxID=1287068 RepID=A0ABQ4HNU1_9ACTN|nr:hypothetical protein [Micromonospora andamanensis]GIJ07306.1 hypothetical protein Van01_05200 [Micromonospora andamanensis]
MEKVCQRGVALRGGATGPADVPTARNVLDDLRAVWVPSERGQHWDTLAGRLADRFPEAYSAVTPEALSALVRGKGVESRNVKSGGATRKGAYLADITTAAQQRDGGAG